VNDGVSPKANLVLDPAGNLYGTTMLGGSNGVGTVFEISPQSKGGWVEAFRESRFAGSAAGLGSDVLISTKHSSRHG